MAQTQFFTRENTDLEQYKSDFKQALKKVKTVKLFSDDVIHFLDTWIEAQKNYIPREDIDNFGKHMEKIFAEKDFYDFIVGELQQVGNNGKIQEYSFNLISQLDDSAQGFIKFQLKKQASEELEKNKNASKKEDEEEMERILEGL